MMIREFKNIEHAIKHNFLAVFNETIWVYLKKTNSRSTKYDPYRDTGYTFTEQSPIPIKARIRQLSPDSLIRRELGIVHSGAIEIDVEDRYADVIKIGQKIMYNKEYYTPFHKNAGNQTQITKGEFGITKIILFKMGN